MHNIMHFINFNFIQLIMIYLKNIHVGNLKLVFLKLQFCLKFKKWSLRDLLNTDCITNNSILYTRTKKMNDNQWKSSNLTFIQGIRAMIKMAIWIIMEERCLHKNCATYGT